MKPIKLLFLTSRAFNSHDSRVSLDKDGRFLFVSGLKRRCELVLNALARLGEMRLGEITSYLRYRFNLSYSARDIKYALEKLCKAKLIIMHGKTRGATYRITPAAQERWRKLPNINL